MDWYPTVTPVLEVSADSGGRGRVELVRDEVVSSRSVWFLVDGATGELVGATPDGHVYRGDSTPAVELSRVGDCTVVVVPSHEKVAVLLVRPAGSPLGSPGVWRGRVGDGARADRDGETNGEVVVCLSDLVPVGGSPAAPFRAAPGDTIVAIDSETLACRATRVVSGL